MGLLGVRVWRRGAMGVQDGVNLDFVIDVASKARSLKSEIVPPPSLEGVRFACDLGERDGGESPSERPDYGVGPCHCSPGSFPAYLVMSGDVVGATPAADGVCGLEETVMVLS